MKTGLKKDGTLKKGYKYVDGGKIVRAGLKAAVPGFKKLAAKTVGVSGLRKKDGTLKKGYMYAKGGKIKKITSK